MFESVLIRRHVEGQQLVDAGTIAETLLFYEHVHVVADRSLLSDLLKVIGPQNLLRMLDINMISLTFVRETLGVFTNTLPSGIQFHNLTEIEIGSKTRKRLSNAECVEAAVESVLGKSRETKRLTKQLLGKIPFRSLQGVSGLAKEDLRDGPFVKKAVEHTIRTLVPNVFLPNTWTFEVLFAEDGSFVVGTDLNFVLINVQYHKIFPPEHGTLGPAYLLSFLQHARTDAYLAADYMAEIVTTPIASGIINTKFRQLLARREKSAAQIEMFQHQFLDDARAVREAINSGERTFGEFLNILEKAQRFKRWLGARNPDAELIREYYKAATADTWVDRLPSKSLRFVLTTAAGIGADIAFPTGGIGTGIGVTLGGIDALLLDRFLKGWRPNQFIEGELRNFISPKN